MQKENILIFKKPNSASQVIRAYPPGHITANKKLHFALPKSSTNFSNGVGFIDRLRRLVELKIEIMKETQELLGHTQSKTTEVYNHVTTKNFEKTKSPLDSLQLRGL